MKAVVLDRLGRTCWTAVLIGMCVGLLSCQAQQPAAGSPVISGPREQPGGASLAGLESGQIRPRSGADLSRAMMPLEKVLAGIDGPAYLRHDWKARRAHTQPDQADVPRDAQRAYARGRQAWLERLYFQAIRHLLTAQKLSPDDPTVLSLLSRVYFDAGNPTQGVIALTKALQADPDDVDNLLAMGKFLLQRDQPALAIVHLGRAEALLDTAPAGGDAQVIRYYLGVALLREGYDLAAVDPLAVFVERDASYDMSSPYARELVVLGQQKPGVVVNIGDAWMRLGDPRRAMRWYTHELADGFSEPAQLLRRRVYVDAMLGRWRSAHGAVMSALLERPDSDELISLLDELSGATGDPADLADRLLDAYRRSGASAPLAVRWGRLVGVDRALSLFEEHLAARPWDRTVLEAALRRAYRDGGASAMRRAVRLVSRAIASQPSSADRGWELLARNGSAQRWLRALDGVDAGGADGPALTYLHARASEAAGQGDVAQTLLRQAMKDGPDFWPARLSLAEMLAERGQVEPAEALLEPVSQMPEAMGVRAMLLLRSGEKSRAMAMLDQLIDIQPRETRWPLLKARLEFEQGQPLRAAAVLERAVEAMPDEPALYEALFDIYGSPSAPPDAVRLSATLLQQALTNISTSPVTRYQIAWRQIREGKPDQAAATLRALVREDPADIRSLLLLLRVLATGENLDGVEAMLVERWELVSRDENLRQFTMGLIAKYLDDDRPADAERWIHRLGKAPITDPTNYLMLVGRLRLAKQGRPTLDATARRLIAAHPDLEGPLTARWAALLGNMRREEQAMRVLSDAIRRHPDDDELNNALGYTWADKGRNLDQARQMIEKAVAKDPRNPSYLDSMGWVLYKLGRFEEAAEWLERAASKPGGQHPVMLDHWADALYRLGQTDRALQLWEMALSICERPESRTDADMAALLPDLKSKIEAAKSGEIAPVAEAVFPPLATPDSAAQ
ncbi:MAG: tetratricopeptide repeat protein [Phycisphaeraceae bacterium]|nr:tetratricopeptide repeat protein [Phycisphaeraceae bacterium]